MSVKFGNEVLYVGETFATESVDKWSDLTEYYALSLHEGRVVRTLIGTNFSERLAEVVVDATESVKKALARAERDKKAHAKREYYEYAWREAKDFGLHRSEWEAIHLKIGYRLPRIIPMLRKLEAIGQLNRVDYQSVVAKILDALNRHDLESLIALGTDRCLDIKLTYIERSAEKALYGDY